VGCEFSLLGGLMNGCEICEFFFFQPIKTCLVKGVICMSKNIKQMQLFILFHIICHKSYNCNLYK
jgi:hypothetical protein